MARLGFLDTETLGLDPRRYLLWEVAIILREGDEDTEHRFAWVPDTADVNPMSLEVNNFYERTKHLDVRGFGEADYAPTIWRLLQGSIIVGSNPRFDMGFLAEMFERQSLPREPWHYRPIDVVDLVMGAFNRYAQLPSFPPWRTKDAAEAANIDPDDYDLHTALGDARLVRDLYDEVVKDPHEREREGR